MTISLNYQKKLTFLFSILIVSSFMSYTTGKLDVIKICSYILSVVSLIIIFDLNRLVLYKKDKLLIFFIGITTVFTALSWIVNLEKAISVTGFTQSTLYPLVLFLSLLAGYKIAYTSLNILSKVILLLAILNALVAFGGALGYINYLPLFGDVIVGRYVFGLNLPSSNGMSLNVNYYSSTQASLMFLYALTKSLKKTHLSKKDLFLIGLIGLSSFLGSSRGVLLAVVVAVGLVFFINSIVANKQIKRRARLLIIVTLSAVFILLYQYYEVLEEAFRLYKGLNNRDTIWLDVLEMIKQNLFFSVGHDPQYYLGNFGSGELQDSSFHNGYLFLIGQSGIIVFLLTYFILFFMLFYGLKHNKALWFKYRWVVASIVFFLVMTFSRTYNIGGLGLVPILLALSLSLVYHASNIEKLQK